MTNDELIALIDGHCEAMKAQVVDPGVKLEYRSGDRWVEAWSGAEELCNDKGTSTLRLWARLAPAPKLVPLDQSDFLGANRVTHLRCGETGDIYAVTYCSRERVGIGQCGGYVYATDSSAWQCSRDNGATWGPCSNEAKA